jgi:hypothetical protein
VRNGLKVLTRDGDWHVVVEDPREAVLATFVQKLAASTTTPTTCWPQPDPGCSF